MGAYAEAGASIGVNGDASDDSALETGAAYVIHIDAQSGNYCGPAVPNASGFSASIYASGSFVVAENRFTLNATNLPPNQTGYFLNSRGITYVRMPGGSMGTLCLGGGQAIGRHNRSWEVRNSGASGTVSLTLDLNDLPVLQVALPGVTWNFQCWFRDPSGPGASNFTDGLSVRFE